MVSLNTQSALFAAGSILVASSIGLTTTNPMLQSSSLNAPSNNGVCITAVMIDNPEVKSQHGYCNVGEEVNSPEPPAPVIPDPITPEPESTTPEPVVPDPTPPAPIVPALPSMITTWSTTIDPTCKDIRLPIFGNVDVDVDWGDGSSVESVIGNNPSHIFSDSVNDVKITIEGTFDSWGNGWTGGDARCLLSVNSWGETETTNLNLAFRDADNIKRVEQIPSTTKDLSWAFYGVESDFTIGNFDTRNVTDMSLMFTTATKFNQDLPFNTLKVTKMDSMFSGATQFNGDISTFDTSKVKNMNSMFSQSSFNRDLTNFDTSIVESMESMFAGNTHFNKALPSFNTLKVTTMQAMFKGATEFNQNISNLDTSNVLSFYSMFEGATKYNQESSFKTHNALSMKAMFKNATNFNQNISDWNVSNVTTMEDMFRSATSFNRDLSKWKALKVTSKKSFDLAATSWVLPRPTWI